jgi:glutathione synthase/RimK-type ligase-like ATP-grasp enzyme
MTHKKCVFLTLEDAGKYAIDDDLAIGPLKDLGWQTESIPWTQSPVDWGEFDLVIIRSCWDYHKHPIEFITVLREIEASGTSLLNSASVVEWNMNKTYLRDLAGRGIPIVPTIWRDKLPDGAIVNLFDELKADIIVIKPLVGASAQGVIKLSRNESPERLDWLTREYRHRPCLIQVFVNSIVDTGEYSVVFMNGEYSHTILKTPASGDFRVQEELGGNVRLISRNNTLVDAAAVLAEAAISAAAAIKAVDEEILYARVDLVEAPQYDIAANKFWLMELELIEPSFFMRLDPSAPERFARAIDSRYQSIKYQPR